MEKPSYGLNEETENSNSQQDDESQREIEEKAVFYSDLEKLKAVHAFQKKQVRKNMHQAMSPINAISGYLELMKMILDNGGDVSDVEKYRSKVVQGVSEIAEIIEQLYEFCDNGGCQLDGVESNVSVLDSHRRAS